MESSVNFEGRAKQLKTRNQARKIATKQVETERLKEQYTKDQYWKTFVKSQTDVENFYRLYYPQYPDELIKAIAIRLENVIRKAKNGQSLSEDEQAFFKEPESSSWDPMEDLKQQEMAGKVSVALKKLEELKCL